MKRLAFVLVCFILAGCAGVPKEQISPQVWREYSERRCRAGTLPASGLNLDANGQWNGRGFQDELKAWKAENPKLEVVEESIFLGMPWQRAYAKHYLAKVAAEADFLVQEGINPHLYHADLPGLIQGEEIRFGGIFIFCPKRG